MKNTRPAGGRAYPFFTIKNFYGPGCRNNDKALLASHSCTVGFAAQLFPQGSFPCALLFKVHLFKV